MVNLLKAMEQEVNQYVKHYQTDFFNYDIPALLEKAQPGDVYYWLTRECGTQLVSLNHVMMKSPEWNSINYLAYYEENKTPNHTFVLTVKERTRRTIKGTMKPILLADALTQIKAKVKTPRALELIWQGKLCLIDWSDDLTPDQAICKARTFWNQPTLDWGEVSWKGVF